VTQQEQLEELFRAVHNDPALFATAVLRVKLRAWQRRLLGRIAERLRAGTKSIEVHLRTCHGAGKTFVVAILVLFVIGTRPESRALTMAQGWAGVENLLWPEITRIYNGSLLRDMKFGRLLTTKLEISKSWYAIGGASDKAENLEGHHSPVCALRVVDEAKAVEDATFISTDGMLDAPENFDVWLSTPSIRSGKFYDRDINGGAGVLREVVTIEDLIEEGVPGKVEWKEKALRDYDGPDSQEYRARAMAEYMEDAEGSLFPLSWIDRAMEQAWTVNGPMLAGFDVAGSQDGDESVVALASGADPEQRAEIKSVTSWRERDTMLSKGKARVAANGARLRVDGIGLGKGVLDSLVADGYPAEEYRASDKAHDPERFSNRKAEDAWQLRRRLENGLIRLPKDLVLKAQLAAMKYRPLPSGKFQVIDPSDSPDHADAVIIALACRPARPPVRAYTVAANAMPGRSV
jgi:hypothetical protein